MCFFMNESNILCNDKSERGFEFNSNVVLLMRLDGTLVDTCIACVMSCALL